MIFQSSVAEEQKGSLWLRWEDSAYPYGIL